MKTVTIQIGNSDDKLSQREWSNFCEHVERAVRGWAKHTHFYGTSRGDAEWQNACWVIEVEPEHGANLRHALTLIRERFKQESVAWTQGETVFV